MSYHSRIEYIDIAKGIAILCVMASHFFGGYFHQLLFAFQIPLFFYLSGFFLNRTKPLGQVVKRRFLQLMVPFLALAAVVCIWRTFAAWHHGTLCLETLLSIIRRTFSGHFSPEGMGPYWFLPTLFFASAIAAFLVRIKRGFLCCLALFMLGSQLNNYIHLSLNLNLALSCVIYVYMGSYCRQNEIMEKPWTNDLCNLAFMLAFWMLGSRIYGVGLSVPQSPNLLLVACAAIPVVCKLSKWLLSCGIVASLLMNIGRHTLFILTIHTCDIVLCLPQQIPAYEACGCAGRLALPLILTFIWCKLLAFYHRLRKSRELRACNEQ